MQELKENNQGHSHSLSRKDIAKAKSLLKRVYAASNPMENAFILKAMDVK